MTHTNIQQLLKDQSLTQESLAEILGVSRPTVVKLIDNPDLMSIGQLKTLGDRCNVSLDYLLDKSNLPTVVFDDENSPDKEEDRDNIPHNDKVKFENAMLYILGKIGAKPNVGQTLLYKIFYFLDFDYYEKYEEQLIGLTYIRNHYGPTPKHFKAFVDEMIQNNKLEEIKTKYFKNEQTKYLPRIEPDLACFKAIELEQINFEIDRFKDMTATEASDLSHQDVPWIGTKFNDTISYEAVFYRTPKTSVRKYEAD